MCNNPDPQTEETSENPKSSPKIPKRPIPPTKPEPDQSAQKGGFPKKVEIREEKS